jgi:signal transduction histidine kinase
LNEVKSSGIRLITAIVRRDERSLWVGSPHGLFAFDKASGVFRQYAHKPSDPSSIGGNAVWVVHKDRLGHLWIGTWDGGLNLFDEENASFRHFTMANGLPSNVIQSIVEDERGDLWIATANGIAHYDQQLETFTNFGLADGFVDVEYEPNAAVVASDGKLFFGGSHGVVSFYPRDLTRPKVLAPMFITALRVGGALRVSEIPNGGSTVIDYDDNDPAFEFAKLDYLEPSEKQYEYMLEGLDPSWIYAGSRSNVNYSNLDEGTYRFLFRTKEDTTETYAATIIIAPPFFQRWWFRGGLVFFVVIVGGLVLQRRISRRKAFQAQLDLATENERLDLAGELHDGPLQDLFGARFLLDSLKEANGVGLQAHTLDNLLKKVRGDLRALTGELQIPSFESGFANELQAFCDRFQERYPRINVIEQISTEMTPLQGRIEQNLFRIVRTAMANVAKHAQASRVTVMFEASRTDFLLRIEDDGVGFRVPTDLRLFTEEKHFGLFLMQSYARTIGAKCSIVSELGNGAMIEVRGVLSRPRWKRKRAGTA